MQYNMLNFSLERKNFAYQFNNALDSEIYDAVSSALEWVKKTRSGAVTFKRTSEVAAYLTRTFSKKLAASLNKHMNINATSSVAPTAMANAWVTYSAKGISHRELFDSINRGQGVNTNKKLNENNFFKVIADKMDYDQIKYDDIAKGKLKINVCITAGMFLASELKYTRDYTAGEITAIIEHEIGHIWTLTEIAGSAYFRMRELSDSIVDMSSNADPDKVKTMISSIDAELDKNKSTNVNIINLKSAVKTIKANLGKGANVGVGGAKVTYATAMGLGLGAITDTMLDFLTPIIYKNIYMLSMKKADEKNMNDVIAAQSNASLTERSADAFVARLGRGGDLATALAKLQSDNITSFTRMTSYRLLGTFVFIFELMALPSLLFSPIMVIPFITPYDTNITRLKQIIDNTASVFKDPEIPAEMRDSYIDQMTQAKQAYDWYRTRFSTKLQDVLWGSILRLYRPDTFGGFILDANLNADYDRLHNATSGYVRNSLYFEAARLRQLGAMS